MILINFKRCLSFALALLLAVSLMPVSALGAEAEETPAEETAATQPTETTVPETTTPIVAPSEKDVVQELQASIDDILTRYLGSTNISVSEMEAKVTEMDWETYQTARWEIANLDESVRRMLNNGEATETEVFSLVESNSLFCALANALEEKAIADNSISTFATDLSLFDGSLTIKDNNGSGSYSNNTVIITAQASLFSSKTNTITFANTTSVSKVLKFTYTVTGADSHTFGKTGNIETILDGGKSVSWSMTTDIWTTKAVLTISNISFTDAASSSAVTINFDSSLGSVTLAGNSVTNGTPVTDLDISTEYSLVATPATNSIFLGWLNTSNELLSSSGTYTRAFAEDTSLQAVFAKNDDTGKAWFGVGPIQTTSSWGVVTYSIPTYSAVFDSLDKANTYALSKSYGGIMPLNSGILAGAHTISKGITLLIPFDANAILCREAPNTSDANALTKPTPFRTLTLAEGASISVDGELSISGTQHSAMAVGTPFGPVGFIQMQSGSNITINNGGKLYAWGYITGTGTGSVTVKSGGTVYECFQVSDWRGSSATSKMSSNEQKIFPITQYYLQNVEVPMRLEAGASEYGFMSVNVTLIGIQTTLVPFVGPNAMFRITSGAIIKDYIESEDRLAIDLDSAELSISPLTLSIKASALGTVTLNSANFVLPLASNMTLNINTGSKVELSQDIAFLPGTEVNIAEGAFCTVTGNSNIYVYDVEAWGPYCGASNKKLTTIAYAPGQQKVRTENDLVDAAIKVNGTVDATNGYLYTTSVPDENGNITGGANIYSEGAGKLIQRAGTNKVTYQATYVKDGYTPHEIPIIPAKLKHEDGTYLDTSSATTATTYNHDHYTCLDHGDTATDSMVAKCGTWYADVHGLSEVETPPTCITEGYTTYTCTCGHSYTANKTDFADHTPAAAVQENIKKATCLEPGSYDSVVYCSVSECRAELSRTTVNVPAAGHSYENGVCKVCGCKEVSFTIAHNLALKDLVQIGYWVKAESTAGIKDVGILIWKEADYFAEDKHDITSDTAVNPAMTSRQGFMMGYGEGIYAQHLDTRYYAVPYVVISDGSYVYSGIPDVYAAPTYAQQMSKQSDKVKTVVRDLLNYGTYAQLYFDIRGDNEINTTTWINDVLTEEQKQLRYDTSMLVKEITANKELPNNTLSSTWRYSTVDLLDAIQLNFHAVQSNAFDKMLYWNEESYDSAATLTADNATTMLSVSDRTVNSDLCTSASISNIYPRDMDKWHYACMYSSTNNTYGPLRVDSIACYLSRMIDKYADFEGQKNTNDYLLQTCKAMLAYGDSAKTYAGQ